MKLKRVLSMFLMVICFFTITGCYKDMQDVEKEFEDDGVFVYKKITDEEHDDYGKYAICGQVNLDLPSSVYVSPFYNGKEVVQLGSGFSSGYLSTELVSPLLKDVECFYLPYTCNFSFTNHSKSYIKKLKNQIVYYDVFGPDDFYIPYVKSKIDSETIDCFSSIKQKYQNIKSFFITKKVFNEIIEHDILFADIVEKEYYIKYSNLYGKFNIICANTTYHFNYVDSPNEDIFFINDFERGEKIENTPYEPIRDGYKFKGWYKEPECVNAWDFEEDTLPAPEYYENGELKYVETCLYAKWEK